MCVCANTRTICVSYECALAYTYDENMCIHSCAFFTYSSSELTLTPDVKTLTYNLPDASDCTPVNGSGQSKVSVMASMAMVAQRGGDGSAAGCYSGSLSSPSVYSTTFIQALQVHWERNKQALLVHPLFWITAIAAEWIPLNNPGPFAEHHLVNLIWLTMRINKTVKKKKKK